MKKIFAVKPITAASLAADVLKKMAEVQVCQKREKEKEESNFQNLLAEVSAEFEKKEKEKAAYFAANHKFLTGGKPVLRRG